VEDATAWQEVTENIGLVKWATNRFVQAHPDWQFEDLFTDAAIACFNAARTYNPSKGTRGTYYYVCIRNGLLQATRDLRVGEKTRTHQQRFAYLGHTRDISELIDIGGDDLSEAAGDLGGRDRVFSGAIKNQATEDPDYAEEQYTEDRAAFVREAVMHLPNEYRDLVVAKFWEGLSFRQIGDRYGVTKQAIQQRFAKAEALLRQMLAPLDAQAECDACGADLVFGEPHECPVGGNEVEVA